ncbi:nuclease [Bacillus phage Chotacabras]|nr:nuclease [Bacillus phage Chotacabras]
MSKKQFYEQDIKDLILNKRHVFIKDKSTKSIVLFEKAIDIGSCIADCLIFTENELIGVEIKTERDSTKRLNKQLSSYSKICDKVYVLVHDKHVEKTEEILERNGHGHVGIVSYTEFKGEPVVGTYKECYRSPKKNVYTMYHSLLWKDEVNQLLGSMKRQVATLEEFGLNVSTADSRNEKGLNGLLVQSMASKRLRKGDMIKMIIGRIGEEKSNSLLCNIYINKKLHIEKNLRYYHFKN